MREGEPAARPGLKVSLAVVLLYAFTIVGATYPRVMMGRDTLPGSRIDPMQHLWVMNWYKSCLVEGKSHVYCPEIQYPIGAPLANFSPMLFQSALFVPLSMTLRNDVLCYNILWFAAFVFSGYSVFVLAWTVLRSLPGAVFAGLAGMLCAPMMLRGHGHLELMFAGSMSWFLASWIGWVDRPRRSGLFATAGLYALTTLCAAYFAVFAVVPAVIYVAWRWLDAGRGRRGPWLRERVRWFAGFLGLVVPALLLAFSAQLWAFAHGLDMHRPLSEYERFGSPIWSYILPTYLHNLYPAFRLDGFDARGYPAIEAAAYLGIVPLLLIGYSATRRVCFERSGYWWFTFGTLAVFSIGAYLRVGPYKIPMPALWLREYVPIFRAIRAPARFNLLACGFAAVLAGAGLDRLLAGLANRWARGAVFLAASGFLVADLGMIPFRSDSIRPAMPACYEWIRRKDPEAALLEAPVLSSGCPHPITTTCAYWQSSHRLRTSSGYSGFRNAKFDDLLVDDSPLSAISLLNPESLAEPDSLTVGIVPGVALADYTWMVAARCRFDYILLHRWDATINDRHPAFVRLAALLRDALVFEDADTLVYEAGKLATPRRSVLLCEGGWRAWRERAGPPSRVVEKSGQVAMFLPGSGSGGSTVLSLTARSHRHPRRVVLREGDTVLARWEIGPDSVQTYSTPPLDLPPGMHTLTLESDGEERPGRRRDQAASWDVRGYSLLVHKLESRSTKPGS